MIKSFTFSFDFDTETETVTNIKHISSVEKKKTTTKRKVDIEDNSSEPKIVLESNKLVFNNKAIEMLDIEYGDRVVVKWTNVDKKMIPIIGKDISFDEEGSGNKVTKSNTISYRGKANEALANVGSDFTLKEFEKDIWILHSLDEKESVDIAELVEKAIETEPIIIIDGEDTVEIEELTFKL